jgi:hypothetical protein
MDFDNLKQQNSLDSSCKAALSFWFGFVGSLGLFPPAALVARFCVLRSELMHLTHLCQKKEKKI